MSYSEELKKYLIGTDFSNGKAFEWENNSDVLYRDEYFVEKCRNKRIIHLGCADHIELIDKKIAHNSYLHSKLISISNVCYGIDINHESIEYLQNKYNIPNLITFDIVSDPLPKEIENLKFDYLLIPDVIEHIGNPVIFLATIKDKLKHNVNEIILSVPNAFRINNFINAFKGREIINTDHRFWFTPYTLSKIAIDAGYDINEMDLTFCEHGKLSRRNLFKRLLISKYFVLRDTLILNIKF